VERLRRQVIEQTGRLLGGIAVQESQSRIARGELSADLAHLRAQQRMVAAAAERITQMRGTIIDAIEAMCRSADESVGAAWTSLVDDDLATAAELLRQLDEASAKLGLAARSAEGAAALADQGAAPAAPPVSAADPFEEGLPRPAPDLAHPDGPTIRAAPRKGEPASSSAVRLGFAIDVVGYSSRSASMKEAVQDRVATIVREALADVSIDLGDTDRQGTGDGINVFLSERLDVYRTVPLLVRAMSDWLARSNQIDPDRLRLRMALGFGPAGIAALGFGGDTIVECARLVDSRPVRQAIAHRLDTDLAVIVSDRLWAFLRDSDHPAMAGVQATRVTVRVKNFRARAWLWAAPSVGVTLVQPAAG
jgi:hypothetical protein